MEHEWSSFWRDVRNLVWGAVDQLVLERLADVLGWGPERSLLELGAGRGLHSKALYETMRAGAPDLFDPCPEAVAFMRRAGLNATGDESELRRQYDIVWSHGLIEHFMGEERQDIVDRHFRFSRDWVLIVVPRRNWQRAIFRPRGGVPHQVEYTDDELAERLKDAALRVWGAEPAEVGVQSFCPLFAVRHIPDGVFPVVHGLVGWALPDGLLLGHARRAVTGGQDARGPARPRP